ncbi:hypothetical protein IQ229_09435 [Nostoc cf. edaphicum LEGE 07299]|uniref:Transposase n=1 Tax=Nostoc cf. edaphicum LEGE 07299 TaxID=2777974 RepID=A0ABR9TXK3_9NOSO|nr:hypothetical protein [Nostoc cf. edaphicum LEGE 07299]
MQTKKWYKISFKLSELFAQIFQQVIERTNVQPENQAVPVNWQTVYQSFTVASRQRRTQRKKKPRKFGAVSQRNGITKIWQCFSLNKDF